MKTLLDKFEEFSTGLRAFSEALVNFCRAVFFLAAASTFIYSSMHLHHLLSFSELSGQAVKTLIKASEAK